MYYNEEIRKDINIHGGRVMIVLKMTTMLNFKILYMLKQRLSGQRLFSKNENSGISLFKSNYLMYTDGKDDVEIILSSSQFS